MSSNRKLLLPFVPLYSLGAQTKNFLYNRSFLRPRSLQHPVISVGSLSAGGAGKTPAVLMLAELLVRHGVSVDVLSRGYGRESTAVEEVDAAGTARRFGDEPLEMARRGQRVFVGADRYATGLLAEKVCHARAHLLDDGFQHRRLRRELDTVLLTKQDVSDRLLPAGNLREPLRSLARAQVVVLQEEEAQDLVETVAMQTQAEVWIVRRELMLPIVRPMRPLVFCGIARPESFFTKLVEAGCTAAGTIILADHHPYTRKTFERLVTAARQAGADGFCTTAKDEVKLTTEARVQLSTIGMLMVPRLRLTLIDEDKAMRQINHILHRRENQST